MFLQALIASHNLLANQKQPEGSVLNHIIPELAKRLIVEEHLKMQNNNGDSERLSRPSPSNSVITKVCRDKCWFLSVDCMLMQVEKPSEADQEPVESPSNVILKIPSYRPTTSATTKNGCDNLFSRSNSLDSSSRLISPPVTSDSNSPPILPGKGLLIKDVITQSITQKFQQSLDAPVRRPMAMDLEYKRGGFTPPLNLPSVIKSQQESNRQYQQQHHQQHPQSKPPGQPGGQPTGGKGNKEQYFQLFKFYIVEAHFLTFFSFQAPGRNEASTGTTTETVW